MCVPPSTTTTTASDASSSSTMVSGTTSSSSPSTTAKTTIPTTTNNNTNKKKKSQRELLIDKLNERVVKITQKEIEKHQQQQQQSPNASITTLAPEFIYAQTPMTTFTAGYPIYQLRSQYLVFSYTAFMIITISYLSTQVLHPLVSLLCILTMFIGYDLYSGILHVVFDHPSNIAIPILGQPCLEFQWHHSIPDDIVRKSFIDVCGDLNVVILIVMIINLYLLPITTNPIALYLGALKLGMAYFGQFSHRSAHSVGKSLPKISKLLQQYGIMISQKDHMDHHTPPYSIDYCLIGVCNPIIDALRKVTTSNTIWLSVFLVWSVWDLYLLTQLVTHVVTYLQLPTTY
jgi:ubiquitin-conjugating enzyme E2 variant